MNALKGKVFTFTALSMTLGFFVIFFTSVSHLMNLSTRWTDQQMENQAIVLSLAWEKLGGCEARANGFDIDQLAPQLYSKHKFGVVIYCDGQIVSKTREAFIPPTLSADFQVYGHDEEYLTYVLGYPVRQGWVVITLSEYYLEDIEDNLLLDIILVTLFLLGLLLLLGYGYLSLQFRGLKKLNKAVDSTGALSALELQKIKIPAEVRPLVNKLNELTEQLKSSKQALESKLSNEKTFTANAAHELLTPMAAIKAEVQLQLTLAQDEQLKSVFSDINDRVDRASYTIDQLMTLARLDPEVTPANYQSFDLVASVHKALGLNSDLVDKKQLDISFTCPDELIFVGIEDAMQVMLSNMFSNACKYALANSTVVFSVTEDAEQIVITTENDCERLPSYLVEHMTDRFIRGTGNAEQGTGLGMSIIKRGCELHLGQLSIAPSNQFTRLKVSACFSRK